MISMLNLTALHATACAVSTEETRYYLGGVCVEISARQTIYVATDGHILFAYRAVLMDDSQDNELLGTWIIPTATIKAAKISKGKNAAIQFAELVGETGSKDLVLKFADGSSLGFKAIDGTFPDWRRVVPEESKQEGAVHVFDPALLARLWKAGEILGLGKPGMGYNGDGPALLRYAAGDDAVGVIMPMRNPVSSVERPAWIADYAPSSVSRAA